MALLVSELRRIFLKPVEVEWFVEIPLVYPRFIYIPGGRLGFQKHQQ